MTTGTIYIRTSPVYYGSATTDADAQAIATQLAADARIAFPADEVRIVRDTDRPYADATDPDAARSWVESEVDQIAQDLTDGAAEVARERGAVRS